MNNEEDKLYIRLIELKSLKNEIYNMAAELTILQIINMRIKNLEDELKYK